MSARNLDKHNRFRCITVGFRVSPEEHEHIPLIKNKATVNTPMVVNSIHIGDFCSTRERTSGAI